jgi:hypothetical protein
MAKISHTSPQREQKKKSRKSVLKTLNLIKQNEQLLKKLK